MREQKAKAQNKTKTNIRSKPPPVPPPTFYSKSTTANLSHPSNRYNNNTIGKEFQLQIRQANKYGSVWND